MALSMANAALDGFTGQGKFSGGAVPVRTLMVAYPNRMHVGTVVLQLVRRRPVLAASG